MSMTELEKEITTALNRHSAENASNTPDFILAQYLMGCLHTWNKTINARRDWYAKPVEIPNANQQTR